MMTLIQDMPPGIVAIRATGHVTGDDYEKVLIPAIDAAHKEHGKIKTLIHFDEGFAGLTAAAMWDDAKVGLKHLLHFAKCAIVTDEDSLRGMIKVAGFLSPCEIKLFGNAELDAAMQWIKE